MVKNSYYDDANIRSIDRSPYRNMPSTCDYCGYRSRPSLSGSSCSTCCLKILQDANRKK